jgi:hypothetical protein
VHDWSAFTIEIKETFVGFHSGCTGGGWQQQAAAQDEEKVEESPIVSLQFHCIAFLRIRGVYR